MIPYSELTICALDLLGRAIWRNTKNIVRIIRYSKLYLAL